MMSSSENNEYVTKLSSRFEKNREARIDTYGNARSSDSVP